MIPRGDQKTIDDVRSYEAPIVPVKTEDLIEETAKSTIEWALQRKDFLISDLIINRVACRLTLINRPDSFDEFSKKYSRFSEQFDEFVGVSLKEIPFDARVHIFDQVEKVFYNEIRHSAYATNWKTGKKHYDLPYFVLHQEGYVAIDSDELARSYHTFHNERTLERYYRAMKEGVSVHLYQPGDEFAGAATFHFIERGRWAITKTEDLTRQWLFEFDFPADYDLKSCVFLSNVTATNLRHEFTIWMNLRRLLDRYAMPGNTEIFTTNWSIANFGPLFRFKRFKVKNFAKKEGERFHHSDWCNRPFELYVTKYKDLIEGLGDNSLAINYY